MIGVGDYVAAIPLVLEGLKWYKENGYERVKVECDHCHGTGRVKNTFMGPGQFLAYVFSGNDTESCDDCRGTGKVLRWVKPEGYTQPTKDGQSER